MAERWTWDPALNPKVVAILSGGGEGEWYDSLESAANDCVVGKVICVCAARAMACEALKQPGIDPASAEALDLLGRWIDAPSDERFEGLRWRAYDDDSPEFDSHGCVWWAIRTAMSAVGFTGASWALSSAFAAAEAAGLGRDQIRQAAFQEIAARMSGSGGT